MTEKPQGERIAKRLARAGVASRREAERMVEAGRVKVNGRRLDSPALNVTERDRIEVDGKALAAAEPARLWRYHKPAGLVTTARDEQGRRTVFDALPPDYRDLLLEVAVVGRDRAELAEERGQSAEALRQTLTRARARLAMLLRDAGSAD